MKQKILNNLKNIYGWKTERKIVVFSVDDYGSVRLDSKKARENMDKLGFKAISPTFDNLDTLESKEDLEILFETLSSVKDKNDNHAVFTPFALPCNIDFEAMEKEEYTRYIYELLPETYKKLSIKDPKAYDGTWELWQEGLEKGLVRPQFHGREHFNLKVFEEDLINKNPELIVALQNRSYTGISNKFHSYIKRSASFDFWKFKENETFKEVISDGLNQFESVFGYRATQFNPPGGQAHSFIYKFLKDSGIKFIDVPLINKEHQGEGNFKKYFNYTGKINELGMLYQVRNAVFEPINNWDIDWINFTINQIETSFFWHRPAIISSHRVNFCGYVDPKNRKKGISALKELLKKIVNKWPDVEFMSSDELGELIIDSRQ